MAFVRTTFILWHKLTPPSRSSRADPGMLARSKLRPAVRRSVTLYPCQHCTHRHGHRGRQHRCVLHINRVTLYPPPVGSQPLRSICDSTDRRADNMHLVQWASLSLDVDPRVACFNCRRTAAWGAPFTSFTIARSSRPMSSPPYCPGAPYAHAVHSGSCCCVCGHHPVQRATRVVGVSLMCYPISVNTVISDAHRLWAPQCARHCRCAGGLTWMSDQHLHDAPCVSGLKLDLNSA